MRVLKVEHHDEQFEQCDISTPTENFYVKTGDTYCLVHNSPAVIFGRDENGKFIFTDKSGFTAKGYDGRAKSPVHLHRMLMNRPGAKRNPEGYGEFADNMAQAYAEFEKVVPESHRGFFKGDMLYFSQPPQQSGYYVFQPNTVKYSVQADSDLGEQIGQSTMGIVIHREVDPDGTETPLENMDVLQGGGVMVMPPVVVAHPAEVDNSRLRELNQLVSEYGATLDTLFDEQELTARQMKDFPGILYAYANSKVDTGFQDLGADFDEWVANSKLSNRKKGNVLEYVSTHSKGFDALWKIYNGIVHVKDDIISQYDSHDAVVKQSIGDQPGGEGYVMAHPDGDIKMVPRTTFSRANRAQER